MLQLKMKLQSLSGSIGTKHQKGCRTEIQIDRTATNNILRREPMPEVRVLGGTELPSMDMSSASDQFPMVQIPAKTMVIPHQEVFLRVLLLKDLQRATMRLETPMSEGMLYGTRPRRKPTWD
jgi:hypothetical protein